MPLGHMIYDRATERRYPKKLEVYKGNMKPLTLRTRGDLGRDRTLKRGK